MVYKSIAKALDAAVSKRAVSPLVLSVGDCHATYERLSAKAAEFTKEPISRVGSVDARFRDPSVNSWKLMEVR